jgi:ubiquinone/menaquinone biosynthesis C-methylase UbiE
MSAQKSEKELAFIRDLYVAPDWGERFAQLVDENVALPRKGRVLYLGAGTGAHALALLEKAGKDVTLVYQDESEPSLEIARAKAAALKVQPQFDRQQLESLTYDEDEFDLVIADTSLVSAERLPEIISEMVRVAAPGATVALTAATTASFGEFFSIYWEALQAAGVEGHESDAEALISELPTPSNLQQFARDEGLAEVSSWTRSEEFTFASAEEFLNAPLISDFLMNNWMNGIDDASGRQNVKKEIERLVDEERSGADFILTVKATLVSGRKPSQ